MKKINVEKRIKSYEENKKRVDSGDHSYAGDQPVGDGPLPCKRTTGSPGLAGCDSGPAKQVNHLLKYLSWLLDRVRSNILMLTDFDNMPQE